MNSTSVAYWNADGITKVDLSTGAVNKLSSDAYVPKANFGLSDNFAVWNGNLLSFDTGLQYTFDPTSQLSGNYLVSGSGTSYTVHDLTTGQQTSSIDVTNGTGLVDVVGTTAIVKDGSDKIYDRFMGIYYYKVSYSAYDILTGVATGWKCSVNAIYPDVSACASQSMFAVEFCTVAYPSTPSYAHCNLGTTNPQWQYRDQGYNEDLKDMWNNSGLVVSNQYFSNVDIWDMSTNTYQCLFNQFMEQNRGVGDAKMNADYVVWTDNYVPEPASCASLVLGLAGLAGFIRKKSR